MKNKNINERTRELGKISYVRFGKHEHYGVVTFDMGIEFGGSHQGFGGRAFGDTKNLQDYMVDLCKFFGVHTTKSTVEQDVLLLKGMSCYALRPFDNWGEDITGLENVSTGKRWIDAAWFRNRFPHLKKEGTELERKQKKLKEEIVRHHRGIQELESKLDTLNDSYVEWEESAR